VISLIIWFLVGIDRVICLKMSPRPYMLTV
jgi:hypothetical protein